MVFKIEIKSKSKNINVINGGRYDKLISDLGSKKQVPAVGELNSTFMITWLASYPKSGNTWLRALLTTYFYSKDGNFNFDLMSKIYTVPRESFF